jgi:Transposase DDE domain group 1
MRNRRRLFAPIPLAKRIEDEFDTGRNSQLIEKSVEVVPYGMLSNIQSLSDFAVLQAFCHEPDDILLAMHQQRHSAGILQSKGFEMGHSLYNMLEIVITGPDLSLVDRPDAFRKSFQGMSATENTPRASTKGGYHVKEGKQATHWTRLSCHRFRAKEARLQLSLLASNLGNLLRRLVLPKRIGTWSLTSFQQRIVKTGGRLIKHARYYWLLLAEGHLHRRLFGIVLRKIAALPSPAG